MESNLLLGWIWVLLGLLAGTLAGLLFHREDWLGGYASWPRRLTRLGHISFLGTGLLNLAMALTVTASGMAGRTTAYAGIFLMVGALTMPAVCYLAAWRKVLRHLFFIPVLSLLAGVVALLAALAVGMKADGP